MRQNQYYRHSVSESRPYFVLDVENNLKSILVLNIQVQQLLAEQASDTNGFHNQSVIMTLKPIACKSVVGMPVTVETSQVCNIVVSVITL